MTNAGRKPNVADRGQALGLRLVTRAGGLGALQNPAVRRRIERVLYRGARNGFRVQTAATTAFARRSGSGAPIRTGPSRPRRAFDLTPTEDQDMMRGVAREFADEVLRPAGAKADSDRSVPDAIREQAQELGLGSLGVPADLGGVAEERSTTAAVLVLEELARGDLGLATSILTSGSVATALADYGTAEQQQTYLPPLVAETDSAIGALALMEPQPLFDPLEAQTTATREGDELIVNGVKSLVPVAATAQVFIVSAMLDGEPRLVIVESGTPGLEVADDPAMGLRAAATGRLHLQNVRISQAQILGTTDDHRQVVRRARLAWAAAAVGVGQAVLDQVKTYVVERQAFGEPIAHRQAVAFTVANIATELDALRLVVWRAAALLDAGGDAGAQIAHARHLAATQGAQIGSDGVQLLGGHGFVKEFDNERWFRDLRATGILEGGLLV
ncbi:acyl-CoA dehydrogenase family protein [Demetria terragena]|uniref:acyl-CoA dehydrogenase family protein n=1 Tax=Demetria terragena TaxID=63959 RepID=UPI00037A9053|nr:acyl-CoA dehydrogenase family protein [Demetria terragena]